MSLPHYICDSRGSLRLQCPQATLQTLVNEQQRRFGSDLSSRGMWSPAGRWLPTFCGGSLRMKLDGVQGHHITCGEVAASPTVHLQRVDGKGCLAAKAHPHAWRVHVSRQSHPCTAQLAPQPTAGPPAQTAPLLALHGTACLSPQRLTPETAPDQGCTLQQDRKESAAV